MKKYLILGMGITGKSVYNALKGEEVYVYDSNPKNMEGLENQFKSFSENEIDVVIKSPGIKTENEILIEARKRKIEIITDLELFYRLYGKKIVAITGTNGKTTTTSLVEKLLINKYKTRAVGNIGVGMMDLLKSDEEMAVVEASSFELNDILTFKPDIAVMTNITPDHLDWHKTFENYKNAKLNILKNQSEEDFAILNYSDEILKNIKTKARTYYFSIEDHEKNGTFVKNAHIYFRSGKTEEKIFEVAKLKLLGNHNLENVLASVCVAKILNVTNEDIEKVLSTFGGVEHRLEFVREIGGVKYFNDSKGTNPASTIKAVESFDSNLILIAGGYQKNADYTELLQIAKKRLKSLILFGETKHDIEKTANELGIESEIVDDLESALNYANKCAKSGDSILLSPACASWDMYSSYEERGNHFKKLVMSYEKI